MRIILDQQILEIGSAGIRCGRWAYVHRKEKDRAEDLVWHRAKFYAYMWSLIVMGAGVEMLDRNKAYKIEEFIKDYRKGYIQLFPTLFTDYLFLMKKNLFERILASKQPHQGPVITKEIIKLCPVIQ